MHVNDELEEIRKRASRRPSRHLRCRWAAGGHQRFIRLKTALCQRVTFRALVRGPELPREISRCAPEDAPNRSRRIVGKPIAPRCGREIERQPAIARSATLRVLERLP